MLRERLVRRLLDATSVPLVLAIAPAGYGKTTALAQWAERDKRETAWITLREPHNDPVRLLQEISLALDELEPIGHDVFAALAAPVARTGEPGLAALLADALAARRGRFVLVLDDVHLLTERASIDAIRTIADHIPEGSQLVLASRDEPRLPIGRMRANRMICELRRQDLAMTRGEAATLLRSTGLALDADDVGRLMERTEGWPAGLYLAALSLQAQPDLERALARFAGDDRIVADYLRDELLAQLPEERLLFLARTSVLDTLSGGLCDAVLDRPDSGRVLKDLARSNILLVPLDRTDERFRYHGLFAEMLKAELRRLEPENEPELHKRAGAWHAERGEIDLAIEHAVAAGDVENAGELLWSIAADYLSHGRNAAIRRWLDQFTGEQIAACAPLALTAAASDLAAGRCDWVEHWASAAERCLDRSSAPAGAGPVATGAAVMRAAVGREGIASMEEDAARACEDLPDDSPWRSLCCLLMGVAAHLSGDREGASERLDEGARRAAVAAPSVRVLCFAQLALIALEREDWELGGAFAGRARSQTIHGALSDYPTSALVFAVSALVRAHLGHVDEAQQDMRHAKDLLARLESFAPWYEVEARIALARASLRLSDVVGARTLLAEASRINRGRGEAIVLTEWLDDAWGQANEFIAASVVGPTSLTTAELRVLRLLPTHLSFREIAGRLNVSANTIKTQAHAVYRKLDASSRSDAVTHARSVGLLDA